MEIILPLYHHICKGKCQHFIYFLSWLFCLVKWSLFPPPCNLHSAFAWFHTDNKSTHLHLSEPCHKSPRCGECSLLAGAKAQCSSHWKRALPAAHMFSRSCCESAPHPEPPLCLVSKTSEIPVESQAEVGNRLQTWIKKLKREGYWFRFLPFGKSFGLVPPLPFIHPHSPELLPNHFSLSKILHSFWSRWQRHIKLSLMPIKIWISAFALPCWGALWQPKGLSTGQRFLCRALVWCWGTQCTEGRKMGRNTQKVKGFPQSDIQGSENSRSTAEQEGEAGPLYSQDAVSLWSIEEPFHGHSVSVICFSLFDAPRE